MKTYILGTGYLSENLKKKISNSEVFSVSDFSQLPINNKRKFNVIINSFYSAKKLNNLNSYKKFIDKSIFEISSLLDKINFKNINKIIYTSSSSVYGSINNNKILNDKKNRYIYSSLKLSTETLLKNYCFKKKIQLIICRVFNLYGPNEEFSIISKLIKLKKNKIKKLIIYNNGLAIRDFIHVDDVVEVYQKLLNTKNSFICDLGTGYGIKIIDLINSMNLNKKILLAKSNASEINESISNNVFIKKYIDYKNFKKIERFLNVNNIPKQKKISENFIEKILVGSIIYGCGYSGIELAKQILSIDKTNVSYFIDDDKKKIGKYFEGIKVLSFQELKDLSYKVKPRNIIVAIPSLSEKKRFSIVKKLLPLSQSVSSLPERGYFRSKKILLEDIQDISFENIFNRNFYEVDQKTLNKFRNKKILITGGAGSIGKEICKQLIKSKPEKIVILDHSELNIYNLSQNFQNKKVELLLGDVKDTKLLNKIIKNNTFDYIFHSAAYKHVKFLETNISSAVKNNILGTYSIIKAIKNKKINFTFISTDKAVRPKNILGMTKRIGELLVQYTSQDPEYKKCNMSIVRFGNVLGSDGSALPLFINQIRKKIPITLTDKKMMRYFMSIKEACSLVIKSTQLKSNNKIFVLDMGKQIKLINIIKKLFSIYKTKDQKMRLKILGNKFNEKISESLFYKKNSVNRKFSKILLIDDPKPRKADFFAFLSNISNEKIINEDKKLYLYIKNFFKLK
tara:strand:- start:7063 stop:9276 length:2214 start_codon:yes stop_codon:yes gene_type:complete